MKKILEPSVKGIFTRVIKSQLKRKLVGGNKAFYLFYGGYDPYLGCHDWAVDYSERGYNAGDKCAVFARGKGLYIRHSEYMKWLDFKFSKDMTDSQMTKIAHNVINVYNCLSNKELL
jgi:hypothetical protein